MLKSEDLEIFMINQANAIGNHLEYVQCEQNYTTSASLKWNTPLSQATWLDNKFQTNGIWNCKLIVFLVTQSLFFGEL